MAQFKVTTKAKGFTGQRAGVNFVDGQALVDGDEHRNALRYFRTAGYGVEQVKRRGAKATGGAGENPDGGKADGGAHGDGADPNQPPAE